MKKLILTLFLALVLATGLAFAHSPQQHSAKSFAARFYRTYLKLNVRGLPDAREYKVLSPLLSTGLRRLIETAKREQESFIRENSSDLKPPWVDGDLFTNLYEGAQSFQLGSPKIRGNFAEVPVHLAHRRGDCVSRWRDSIVLIRTKDGWRVWDILLKGDWPFKNGDGFRSILKTE